MAEHDALPVDEERQAIARQLDVLELVEDLPHADVAPSTPSVRPSCCSVRPSESTNCPVAAATLGVERYTAPGVSCACWYHFQRRGSLLSAGRLTRSALTWLPSARARKTFSKPPATFACTSAPCRTPASSAAGTESSAASLLCSQ